MTTTQTQVRSTDEALSVVDTLKLALEALELMYACYVNPKWVSHKQQESQILEQTLATITAIKAALEAHKALMSVSDGAQPAVTESHKQSTTCGEPVGHRDGYWCDDLTCKKCYSADFRFKHKNSVDKECLTTSPTQQSCLQRPSRSDIKPLTDEEFQKICTRLSRQGGWENDAWDLALKEAIEQAYGITASEAEDSARSKT